MLLERRFIKKTLEGLKRGESVVVDGLTCPAQYNHSDTKVTPHRIGWDDKGNVIDKCIRCEEAGERRRLEEEKAAREKEDLGRRRLEHFARLSGIPISHVEKCNRCAERAYTRALVLGDPVALEVDKEMTRERISADFPMWQRYMREKGGGI